MTFFKALKAVKIMKERLWRYNLRPLRHQQNSITLLKLYGKCRYVTKIW